MQPNIATHHLETFFDLSPDLMCIVGMDGCLQQINRTFGRVLGYRAEEVVCAPFIAFVHVDDRAQTVEAMQRCQDGVVTLDFQNRCRARDGSYRLIAWSVSPKAGEQSLYCVGRDLTDHASVQSIVTSLEQRLAMTLDQMTDAFCLLDREWRFVYLNQEAERLLQHPSAQMVGQSVWKRFPPTTQSPLFTELHRAVEKQEPVHFELFFPPLDHWFEVHAYPAVESLAVYFQAITERKQTTDRLRASEQQYRLLFANNPHPMWVYDVQSLRFLAVNEMAIAHYGYSEDEFLSMTIRDIRPVRDIPSLEEVISTLPRRSHSGLWRHRKKDGTLIEVEVSGDMIQFNGREARLVLANDVTARRRAEEQLRQQAALLDKAQDAIMVRDLDHRITYWNRSAERLYGWSAEEAVGCLAEELLYKDRTDYQDAYRQVTESGEWFGEMQQVDRNGRTLLIEARWTLVRDECGKPSAILTINTDITERKKLEAQFMRAQRMESIGTLAGGIAHDLNNVLSPILLAVGMLKRQQRTPMELKLLNTLESSAQRGADMVRQVLSFARGMDGERIVTDVGLIVQDLGNLICETFDRRIHVKVKIGDDLWPVLGDPTHIHQVLLNLCVNSRDAMPNGGELELSVSAVTVDSHHAGMDPVAKAGNYVLLRVADSGTGIPAALRERIFDPFFTTKEVGKGTGLGLSTVQAVVKSHGGFINVYSEEGRGTEFKIYLPVHESEFRESPLIESPQLPRPAGAVVLVVDDEAAIRFIMRQTLEAFGYRVLTAEDGAEALSIYAEHQNEIGVVLTDMMMPGMDGFSTIQALLKLDPHAKIIAASGLAANDMVAKAASVGITHFLQKPYGAETLLTKIAEILQEEKVPAL
ncbi:MAG: PAS domain S-box protein [Caldilineaceae bacterium]|nr:PAS domain S-box protein [Caldilineaceae bacterium]